MKKYKHITNYDRIQIEALMRAGHSIREIAEQLDKNYYEQFGGNYKRGSMYIEIPIG